jgi:hypothetical protein
LGLTAETPSQVHDVGDGVLIKVPLKVEHGPASCQNRLGQLILTPDQALHLAAQIIGQAPALQFGPHWDSDVLTLEKYCKMFRAALIEGRT